MNEVARTERHIIKKNHILYSKFEEITFASKNLYNLSNYYMRQVFIICDKIKNNVPLNSEQLNFLEEINNKVNDYNKFKENNLKMKSKEIKKLNFFDADNKSIKYDFLNFLMKNTPEYKSLYAQTSQQCLKLLEKNWKSFFNSIKDWKKNPSKYFGKPKLPKYLKKNGKNIIIFTNQLVKYCNNQLIFPRKIDSFKLKTKINGKFQQVRVLPRNNSFVIEIVYRKQVPEFKKNNGKYVGVDLGVNNLAALTNSENILPVLISGKKAKSINQYYNKKLSFYRKVAKQMNNKEWSNKMEKITLKRNNIMKDCFHKASKSIVDYALSCEANTVVIGYNQGWKTNVNMGKKVNQMFVGMPHKTLIEQIRYKCEEHGINVELPDERYTSGTSFLDNEKPVKELYDKKRRVRRGLFKSNAGKFINADINASLQIIKKVSPDAFNKGHGVEGCGFNPVKVVL